jgi:hypothetical protein
MRDGAVLARWRRMIRSIITVALLCAPALADPSPTFQLGFDLTAGTDVRHYAVKLVDNACGGIDAKSPSSQDEIKVCVVPDGPRVRVSVDWVTRQGDLELRNRSTVSAARGQTYELDGGTAKLAVGVQ